MGSDESRLIDEFMNEWTKEVKEFLESEDMNVRIIALMTWKIDEIDKRLKELEKFHEAFKP